MSPLSHPIARGDVDEAHDRCHEVWKGKHSDWIPPKKATDFCYPNVVACKKQDLIRSSASLKTRKPGVTSSHLHGPSDKDSGRMQRCAMLRSACCRCTVVELAVCSLQVALVANMAAVVGGRRVHLAVVHSTLTL